jgi:hypothetical protein
MRPLIKCAGIACVGLLALAATSSAVLVVYEFPLTGAEENPPVIPSGTGFATVTLDTASNFLTWDVSFSDLVGTYTNAHFHGPAAIGVNAGVILGIHQAEFVGLKAGNLVGNATIDETFKQQILDGVTYINIHSNPHTSGELRGQVIPEPSTYALFAGMIALAGAWFWRRRARR